MSETAGIDVLAFGFKGDTSDIDKAAAHTEGVLGSLTRRRTGKVDIDVETGQATARTAALEGTLDAATRDRDVEVNVDTDAATRGVLGLSGALGRLLGRSKSSARGQTLWTAALNAGRDVTRAFTGSLGMLSTMASSVSFVFVRMGTMMLMLTAVLPQVISLITTLVTGFFSLGAAAAPAVGVLAALPGVLAGAAAGVGALLLGFTGISKALQAASQAETKSEGTARRLADARRALASANDDLAAAERAVGEARAAYPETLEDAQFAAAEAALAQRQAILDLSDAQKRFNDMQRKTAKSTYEVMQQTDEFSGKVYDVAKAQEHAADAGESQARLRLALKQAELAVAVAKDRHSDAEKALQKLQRGGADATDAMIAALQRRESAQEAVTAAQRALTDAGRVATGQTDAYRAAMAKLTPEGRSFVRFLKGEWLPQWRAMTAEIQSRLLPGIEDGLRNLIPTMRLVGSHLADLAGDFGTRFAAMTKRLGDAGWVRRINAFMETAKSSARNLATAVGFIIRGLMDLVIASRETSDWMTGGLAKGAERFANAMHAATAKGSGFKKFLASAREAASNVWQLIKNLSRTLFGLGKASNAALGRGMMADLLAVTAGWADFVNSAEGSKKVRAWFREMKEPLYAVADSIRGLAKWWTEFGTSENFLPTLHAIENIAAAFGRLLEGLGKSNAVPILLDSFGRLLSMFATLTDHFGVLGVVFGLVLTRMALTLGTQLGRMALSWGGFLVKALAKLAWFAIRAAAQWLIALGPIGWVIAAVVALVALIIWKWKDIKKWTVKIFGAVWDWIKDVWDKVKGAFAGVIDWIKANWKTALLGLLTGPFGLAVIAIVKYKDKILGALKGAWQWLKDNWKGLLFGVLTSPFGLAAAFVRDKWDGIVGFLAGLGTRVARAAVGMWDGIKDSFRAMLNTIVGWWNGLDFSIPSFKIPVPGMADITAGGFSVGMPDLPAFKQGGRPPVGVPIRAAENRAELFVLDKPGRIAPNLNSLGGGGRGDGITRADIDRLVAAIAEARAINVDVTQNEHADPQTLAAAIAWEAGL